MKERYQKPSALILPLFSVDVIATSPGGGSSVTPNPDPALPDIDW